MVVWKFPTTFIEHWCSTKIFLFKSMNNHCKKVSRESCFMPSNTVNSERSNDAIFGFSVKWDNSDAWCFKASSKKENCWKSIPKSRITHYWPQFDFNFNVHLNYAHISTLLQYQYVFVMRYFLHNWNYKLLEIINQIEGLTLNNITLLII